MTQLVPQASDLVVKDDDTVDTLLTRVAARKAVAEPETPHKEPRVIPVSEVQQNALKHVTRDLRTTNLPSERRLLSPAEIADLITLGVDVKASEKTLAVANAAIKTAVFNHFDVGLEMSNPDEELPYDEKSGHYLVKNELVVEDKGLRFCRELKQGSPDLTADHLLALYEDGKMTRAEYLKSTRQIRVLDEDGLMAVLRKRADFLEDIEEVIEPGKVTASFHIREVKKDQDAS